VKASFGPQRSNIADYSITSSVRDLLTWRLPASSLSKYHVVIAYFYSLLSVTDDQRQEQGVPGPAPSALFITIKGFDVFSAAAASRKTRSGSNREASEGRGQ
jgi:hypothetical protein